MTKLELNLRVISGLIIFPFVILILIISEWVENLFNNDAG